MYNVLAFHLREFEAAKFATEQKAAAFSLLFSSPRLLTEFLHLSCCLILCGKGEVDARGELFESKKHLNHVRILAGK